MEPGPSEDDKVQSQEASLGRHPYGLKWPELDDPVSFRDLETHLHSTLTGIGDVQSAACVFWQCLELSDVLYLGAIRKLDGNDRLAKIMRVFFGPTWEQIVRAPDLDELQPEAFLDWATSPVKRDARVVVLLGAAVIVLMRGQARIDEGASDPDDYRKTDEDVVGIAHQTARALGLASVSNATASKGRRSYYLSDTLGVVGPDELEFSLSTAVAVIEREHASCRARASDYAAALRSGIAAYRRLLDNGVMYRLVSESVVDILVQESGGREQWFELFAASHRESEDWHEIGPQVNALSHQISSEVELKLLAGSKCPDWLLEEADYWAHAEVPFGIDPTQSLRRDVAAIRRDVEVTKQAEVAAGVGRFPRIRNSLALQMVEWAAEKCHLDCFDLDGLFRRLERDPADRIASAGIFWTCQCVCENHLLDRSRVDPDVLPEWDEIQRLLLGPDWEQGVALMHWNQIVRLREHTMFQAGAYLDWVEPYTERDPCVAIMYGAGLITLLVSIARNKADGEPAIHYYEDLKSVFGATIAQVARSWQDVLSFRSDDDENRAYYTNVDNTLNGDDKLSFSVSTARRLAQVEHAFMQYSLHGPAAAIENVCTAAASMLDDGVLIDGVYVAHLDGPFATSDSSVGFDRVKEWFEALLVAPDVISDWEWIQSECLELSVYLSWDMDMRRDMESADFDWPDREWAVPAWEELTWAYWEQARARASSHLSADQYRKLLRRDIEDQHRVRLETDYFHSTWGDVEQKAKEAILSAELTWFGRHSLGLRIESVLNEWRIALEFELRALLVSAAPAIERAISAGRLPNGVSLRSLSFEGLMLGDVARLLGYVKSNESPRSELHAAVDGMHLDARDYQFLTGRLLDYAKELTADRNDAEHPAIWNMSTVAYRRRQLLGIDCSGILPWLVRTKRKLRATAQRPPAEQTAG